MIMRRGILSLLVGVATMLSACSVLDRKDDKKTLSNEEAIPMTIQLTSLAFTNNSTIPTRYARKGENISPPLAWSGAPSGIESFVLIVDDPDAPRGDWVHWLVYNLPPSTTSLPEGIQADTDLPGDAVQGKNDWDASKYDGPQPPSGTHRYVFKLYALDTVLDLKAGVNKTTLLNAMESHVLARGELMGKYSK